MTPPRLVLSTLLAAVLLATPGPSSADEINPDSLVPRRFLVIDSGKVGYIDETGSVKIPLTFESGRAFSDGLAAVQVGKRQWGFVDASGRLAIPATFSYVRDFHDGYAAVEVGDKWGIIDKRGEFTVKPIHERLSEVREGAAAFKKDKKSGIIDVRGNVLVPAAYDHVSPPKDGWCIVKRDGRYFFIDTSGNVTFDPVDIGDIAWEFSEGLTPIRVETRKARGRRRAVHRWGYIDKAGKMVVKPKFIRAHGFSEGLAEVETNKSMGFRFGYANAKGDVVIKPRWPSTEKFSNGLAVVKVGNKFGYINKRGIMVIEAKYDSARSFHDGLANVELHSCADEHRSDDGVCQQGRSDRIGYIDASGSYVWEPTPRR